MHCVLAAEGAILLEFKTVRGVLLVLHSIVVSLLALAASQGNFDSSANSHFSAPPCFIRPLYGTFVASLRYAAWAKPLNAHLGAQK
jgi:hypothetical protein